jgi:DNA helicase IV
VLAELRGHDVLLDALDWLWPELTPEDLLADLFGSRRRIESAAAALPAEDRAALYRDVPDAWTTSDVPLLDEATEQLGRDDSVRDRRARQAAARRLAYARGVLQVLESDDDSGLRAADVIDPETLAERYAERDTRTLAERAAADREWTYGHVVVDEAQELSEMDWRVLARRCPSRSFTVVGDLSQRQSPAGARTWGDMLDRYVPGRWVHRALTVNYRMPAELAVVAARVQPSVRQPRSVRSTGVPPWAMPVSEEALPMAVADVIGREAALVGDGTVAVIVPEDMVDRFGVPVLTPDSVRGLEFDSVVVVEPDRIWSTPDSGTAQLYVSVTRATQRMGFVHTRPLSPALAVVAPQ